jgi:ribosomal protein S18 acetylase RimI-like enzyme
MPLHVRPAEAADESAVWEILEPVLRAGETYALPRDWTREEALAFWLGGDHDAFVADDGGRTLGTYYIHPNQRGGGSHVANCGYVTRAGETGRGVARAMAFHSLDLARRQGYRAMQFNFVVSSNERAVALWKAMGFEVVGTLPHAFRHPSLGYVDALVMFRQL